MSYPGALDSFTNKADNFDDVMANDINELQNSIMAMQAYFGTQIQFNWLPLSTCTYVSPTSFTLTGDWTSFLKVGVKFKCSNGIGKFGYILSSTYSSGTGLTTVTLVANTSYALAAGTISGAYISFANPPDFPEWFSYALSWTAATTNPVIGNGEITAVFRIDGKDVLAQIRIKPGSTTTFGVGNYSFSLPVTALQVEIPGIAWGWRGGYYTGVAIISVTGTAISIVDTATHVTWANNQPGTWANGDHINARLNYRIG